MRWLCKLGIHRWKAIGYVGLFPPAELRECQRCGWGRSFHLHYWQRYTPESMAALKLRDAEVSS